MDFFEKYKADMMAYVKEMLHSYDTAGNPRKTKIKYSRFEHTMRVYKWVKRLYAAYPDRDNIDLEVLSIATIFHDIGYCDMENRSCHAQISANYCREYLLSKQYPSPKIDFVCDIVARHSDKKTIYADIPGELIILMEADLLDDIGAQGLVMDAWLEVACEKDVTFESILAHMERYTLRMMQDNPMRTQEGIRIWNEKKQLTEAFVKAYREDLRMEKQHS